MSIGDVQVFIPSLAKVRDCFKLRLGNGDSTRFWLDSWAAPTPLRFLFPRCYGLAVNKEVRVSSQGSFSDSVWTWRIDLCSLPRGRTREEFQRLSTLLLAQSPSHSSDAFVFSIVGGENFSTALIYELQSPGEVILPKEVISIIWLKWLPPRVSVFSWKLANNALPVNWNILSRGFIPRDFDPLCCLCHSDLETIDHRFLHCRFTAELWAKIISWWNIHLAVSNSVSDFLQQCQFVSTEQGTNNLFQVVCICTFWAIWFGRNNLIFNGANWDPNNLFHFIQSRSFAWIRSFESGIYFTPSDWFLFPREVAKLF